MEAVMGYLTTHYDELDYGYAETDDEDDDYWDSDTEWEDWDDCCIMCGHASHIGSCWEAGCDCGEDWHDER
jgi:hypothetical protein